MNKIERSILGHLIKRTRLAHKNAWCELKRQIWDYGFQSYYPAQDYFDVIAKKQLSRISTLDVLVLTEEWEKTHPELEAKADQVLEYYRYLIIVELVRRAGIAAYRTEY